MAHLETTLSLWTSAMQDQVVGYEGPTRLQNVLFCNVFIFLKITFCCSSRLQTAASHCARAMHRCSRARQKPIRALANQSAQTSACANQSAVFSQNNSLSPLFSFGHRAILSLGLTMSHFTAMSESPKIRMAHHQSLLLNQTFIKCRGRVRVKTHSRHVFR